MTPEAESPAAEPTPPLFLGLPLAPDVGTQHPIGGDEVRITSGVWGDVLRRNAETLIPQTLHALEERGVLARFDAAGAAAAAGAGAGESPSEGGPSDAAVYLLLEAMAWEIGRTGNEELRDAFDALAARVSAAQEPDGYLNTRYGREGQPPRYSDGGSGDELTCAAALLRAAVARLRTTGRDEFVEAALNLATHLIDVIGSEALPTGADLPGIESALVELVRATDAGKYMMLAMRVFEGRFPEVTDPKPAKGTHPFTLPTGDPLHAFTVGAGAADVGVATQNTDLLITLVAQAEALLEGDGSAGRGPRPAAAEVRTGVAAVHLFQRLLLATGQVRWADEVERILTDVVLPVLSDGDAVQRLVAEDPAAAADVARLVASLPSYVATRSMNALHVNQYARGEIETDIAGAPVHLSVETGYPREARISVTVDVAPPTHWALSLRVPHGAHGAHGATLTHGGETTEAEAGYVDVESPAVGSVIELVLP